MQPKLSRHTCTQRLIETHTKINIDTHSATHTHTNKHKNIRIKKKSNLYKTNSV